MQNWGGPNPDPLLEAKYARRKARDYDLSAGIAFAALAVFIAALAVVIAVLL